ncbi:glycosyltransferase family 2 protein [Candidatus Dependentiae bacterium]|nr:glycosyltransferase family 2 protein [Candidatus Dependentiae bacterium]
MHPISVIIPVYNEETGVIQVINDLNSVLKNAGIEYELIAVNDGSTDNTRNIINEIKTVKVIHHPYNKGYGAALKTGIKHSKYDYICIIDADNTYPIVAIPEMHKFIGEYDMVVGARIGLNVDIPFAKKHAKIFITKLANYLVGTKIPDLNSGLRIFKKEAALYNMNILPSGFSFTTTITCAMMSTDYFVKFYPIDYFQRTGDSKIRPFHAFEFFLLVIRLIVYFKPLKIFLPASVICFAIGALRTIYTIIRDNWKITELSLILLISALMIFLIGLLADMFVKSRGVK